MPKALDLTGQKYGRLTAIRYCKTKNGCRHWLFKCDCGEEATIAISSVRTGRTISCGCARTDRGKHPNYKDLSNRKFGFWKVIKRGDSIKNGTEWICKCKCGTIKEVQAKHLLSKTSTNCGCRQKQNPQVALNRLKYKIDNNGCYICTSHKLSNPENNARYKRLILKKELDVNLPMKTIGKITMRCGNRQCINPDHMSTSKKSLTKISKTFERISNTTQNKRIEQIGLIKQIQHVTKKLTIDGDIIQTPGPGKIAINYCIFEHLLSKESKYIIVEADKNSIPIMRREIYSLNKKLNSQISKRQISLFNREIFKYTAEYIKKGNKVSLLDACLCATLSSITKNGILTGIHNICSLQKEKENNFIFSLTFSLRGKTREDEESLIKINQLMEKYKGQVIYNSSYADGAPMKTIAWYIQP